MYKITLKPGSSLVTEVISEAGDKMNQFVSNMKDSVPTVISLYTGPEEELAVIASMPIVNEEGLKVVQCVFRKPDFPSLVDGLSGNCQSFCWHSDYISKLDEFLGGNFASESIQSELIDQFEQDFPDFKISFLNPLGTAQQCGVPFQKHTEGEDVEKKLERMVVYCLFLVLETAEFNFGTVSKSLNLRGLFRQAQFVRFGSNGKLRVVS